MAETWECGPTTWLEVYIDSYSKSNMVRTVEAELPRVTGDVYISSLWVQLNGIATDSESVLVNVEILEWTWNDADPCTVYASSVVIQVGDYLQFSSVSTDYSGSNPNCHKSPGDNLEWTWRVYCDSALYSSGLAEFHICDYHDHTGPAPGPIGDPLLAAQYFDTTSFGETGGCIVQAITDNPLVGGGKNTMPTSINWNLYEWNTDYSTTIDSTSLATSDVIIPSEEMNNDLLWIPFYWNDLSQGEYLWSLYCYKGSHDGSFQLEYWDKPSAQKWPAWVNGVSHDNFNSKILGIESVKTWERIMNIDDTFSNHYYTGFDGYEKIKMNTSDGYKDVMTTKKDSNSVCRGIGILNIENPSFEIGNLTGWVATGYHNHSTIEVSNEWSSNGIHSAKFHMPKWNPGEAGASLFQNLDISSLSSGWKLMWDMYASGDGTYKLEVYMGSNIVYNQSILNGEYLDVTVDITSGLYLYMITKYYCCGINYDKTLYIDNIRFIPPDKSVIPIGRIVGGSSNINVN